MTLLGQAAWQDVVPLSHPVLTCLLWAPRWPHPAPCHWSHPPFPRLCTLLPSSPSMRPWEASPDVPSTNHRPIPWPERGPCVLHSFTWIPSFTSESDPGCGLSSAHKPPGPSLCHQAIGMQTIRIPPCTHLTEAHQSTWGPVGTQGSLSG